jgi:hypothetical protein
VSSSTVIAPDKKLIGKQPEFSGQERSTIRVLMIGPSLDFVGGQAIQALRLLSSLGHLAELEVTFFPLVPVLLRTPVKTKFVTGMMHIQ